MMMSCGHLANGKDALTGKPVCVVCQCYAITDMPDLTGREASCILCGKKGSSKVTMPFFEYKPNQCYDSFYDGCRGFD